MDWQQPAALAVVAATALWIAWSRLRPRPPGFRAVTGCGCGSSSGPKPPSVCVTGRRGERPRVIITPR